MDCTQIQDRVIELLSSSVDPACDLQGVLSRDPSIAAHLAECLECSRELPLLIEAWACVGLSAENVAPADLAERLTNQILNRSVVAPVVDNAQPSGWKSKLLSYCIAAGILALLIGGQLYYLQRVTDIANATQDPSELERVEAFEQAVAELQRLQEFSRDVRVQLVSLSPGDLKVAGEPVGITGHAVWDADQRELHFFANRLPKLNGGNQYAVWFVAGDDARLATTFSASKEGVTAIRTLAPPGFAPTKVLITVDQPDAVRPSNRVLTFAEL